MTISSQTDDSGTAKCRECGAATSPTANFCGECGASQLKRAPQSDFYPNKPVCHEGMTMNLDMEDAIKEWLAAREQCSGGCCGEKLEPFTNATNMLYATFSEDWQGDDRTLHVAFQQFIEALVVDGDWGYRHLEVSAVYPNRSK
jgi:hypothetical protein